VNTIITAWAAAWLVVAVGLTVAARRIGPARASAWLVVLGLALLVLEEPVLTLWLASTGQRGDRDGMNGLVTPMARAHVLDAAVFGLTAAVLLGWIALTAFRRGHRWAHRVLRWGLAVTAVTEAATVLFVFSRGLPLPGPGGTAGRAGFGWQPVAAGLLAWALGLWVARTVPTEEA
jgi:hypothetical protein